MKDKNKQNDTLAQKIQNEAAAKEIVDAYGALALWACFLFFIICIVLGISLGTGVFIFRFISGI